MVLLPRCTVFKKEYDEDFFVGKSYSVSNDNTPAYLGGAPKIIFHNAGSLSYSTGDVMNPATYTIVGKRINIKNVQNQDTFTLIIQEDSILRSQKGVVYKLNK